MRPLNHTLIPLTVALLMVACVSGGQPGGTGDAATASDVPNTATDAATTDVLMGDNGTLDVPQDVVSPKCPTAIPLALDELYVGDTSLDGHGTNSFEYNSDWCAGDTHGDAQKGAASQDVAHQFVAQESIAYQVTLVAIDPDDPTEFFESVLYVVTDCGDIEQTCVGAADELGAGEMEVVEFNATAGTPYFIIVDGWHSIGDGGAYTLIVEPAPQP